MSEENYPDVGIDSSVRVLKEGDGWRWTMTMHFVGPDTKVISSGKLFKNKQDCIVDMVHQYADTSDAVLDQYGK